jgi:hypothetical protein
MQVTVRNYKNGHWALGKMREMGRQDSREQGGKK